MLQDEKENYAVTRIRTWVASATTKSTNHYTITAIRPLLKEFKMLFAKNFKSFDKIFIFQSKFLTLKPGNTQENCPFQFCPYLLPFTDTKWSAGSSNVIGMRSCNGQNAWGQRSQNLFKGAIQMRNEALCTKSIRGI